MTIALGTVPAGTTLYIPFASYAGSTGASVTLTGLAVTDIEIFKNGSATQRASDAGFALLDTDGIDFDGITGIHGFSIDLSDNTDSGFWSVGAQYWVVVSAVTVDSQTVNFIAAVFRIGPAEVVAGYPSSTGIIDQGTAQAATGTTLQLRAGATFADDEILGAVIQITGGSAGVGQSRTITDYVSSTDTATVDTWTTTPTGTITYTVWASPPLPVAVPAVNVTQFGGVPGTFASGIPEVKVASIAANAITATAINADAITAAKIADGAIDAATFAAGAINAAAIAADAITDAKVASDVTIASVTGAVGSVTGNVGGNVVGSVASVTAAVTVTGDLSATMKASVNAEVDTALSDAALATAANLATVAGDLNTEIAAILADTNELQTDWANGGRLDNILDARASQASVDTIDGIVDSILVDTAEIKAVTDKVDNVLTLTSDGYVFNSIALQQVWDEPLAGHLVSGSAGAALFAANESADKIDDTLTLTSDGYVFSGAALQAVWDEPIAGHLVSGTTGAALNAAGSAGDPWSTPLPGGYGAGTAGYIIDAINDISAALFTTLEATSDGFAFTANALEFAPSGSGPSASAIADEVQTRTIAAVTVVNGLAANSVTAAAFAADAGTEIGTAVWASATRTLTALDEDATTLDLDATIRAAVGLASADLDTQLDAIDSKTTNLPSDPADQSLLIAATTAIYDRIGAPAAASVSADIAAVKGDTVDIEADTQDIQSRIPAALVSGRIDVTVGAMQANVLTASALAADAGTEIADALLNRDMSAVSDTNARSPLNALRFLRNKWAMSGTTLTVYGEDDTTAKWTAVVSTSAGADPIVGSDPG